MSAGPDERIGPSSQSEAQAEFMRRWGRAVRADERRRHERFACHGDVFLIDPSEQTILRCAAGNISEGGLYVVLSAGSGVRLGQRYEIRIVSARGVPERLRVETIASRATVVRTELVMAEEDVRLGVGLRFDSFVAAWRWADRRPVWWR